MIHAAWRYQSVSCELSWLERRITCVYFVTCFAAILVQVTFNGQALGAADDALLRTEYESHVYRMIDRYCSDCHAVDIQEAEIDFSKLASGDSALASADVWIRVRGVLESRQMPPPQANQPTEIERESMQRWVRDFLRNEAAKNAGDPGPILFRRLNNAEFNYTVRDLTGIPSLHPTREFPADGAAGEGFTNAASALPMSPAMVSKYLEASKSIADHAVLLPGGFRFSSSTSRRDWTEEYLGQIRGFYAERTAIDNSAEVNLQGVQFQTNQGGRLPLLRYLQALAIHRNSIDRGDQTLDRIAANEKLSAKYLKILWSELNQPISPDSPVLDRLRRIWREANGPEAAQILLDEIEQWQSVIWKYNTIGHISRHLGNRLGPERWMDFVLPLFEQVEVRMPFSALEGDEISLYLNLLSAGDGSDGDAVLWENPRLLIPGRPELPLKEVRRYVEEWQLLREEIASTARQCLEAAEYYREAPSTTSASEIAERFRVPTKILLAWLELLGLLDANAPQQDLITTQQKGIGNSESISGWVGENALSVIANASDQLVRIPGNMFPHSVGVHPTPLRKVAVRWQCPKDQSVSVEGIVQDAHPECGNGVSWSVELRRGSSRLSLGSGIAIGGEETRFGPYSNFSLKQGDRLVLLIGPKDNNHFCDLTRIDLSIESPHAGWRLSELSANILAGNPQGDRFGHSDVWAFFSEPDLNVEGEAIPYGTLLAEWQSSGSKERRREIAAQLQSMLTSENWKQDRTSPDGKLCERLLSIHSPLLRAASVLEEFGSSLHSDEEVASFGSENAVDPGWRFIGNHLLVERPGSIQFHLPTELVVGAEFVARLKLPSDAHGERSSVQAFASFTEPAQDLMPTVPVLVKFGTKRAQEFEQSLRDFANLFPPMLCYAQIVPVDEVITLNLFYREDDHLKRLMLDDIEIRTLDRLWDELLYVSQEPILLDAAIEQLIEYATQDRPDKVEEFLPIREHVKNRAEAFLHRVESNEEVQLAALVNFAERAYRRPITESERKNLQALYARLRDDGMEHEEAFRLTLARIFLAPPFLYRLESPASDQLSGRVNDFELASRLSYFLWSSMPDEELYSLAAKGILHREDRLLEEIQRMIADPKFERFGEQFAAQWLHIYEFDQHNEKSETLFPQFEELRHDMYRESILFFVDLVRRDRPVDELFDAQHSILNGRLAAFYGIPDVVGDAWRTVEGVQEAHRGGVLTQASVLAKQAGASRTSPILRGNWLNEVLLGRKLPKPPKNVPTLSELPPEGLTERQMIELHSRDAACAICHQGIDPFGFAFESYDAIGRYRERDAKGLPIDANAILPDGQPMKGIDGLKDYLLRQHRSELIYQLVRKMFGYAMGRSIQLSDEPVLESICSRLANEEDRLQAIIRGIVTSRPFLEIRGSTEIGRSSVMIEERK